MMPEQKNGMFRVDLDYDDSVRYRVMCELYICSTDDLNRVNDLVCLLLKSLLNVLRDCEHRSGAE